MAMLCNADTFALPLQVSQKSIQSEYSRHGKALDALPLTLGCAWAQGEFNLESQWRDFLQDRDLESRIVEVMPGSQICKLQHAVFWAILRTSTNVHNENNASRRQGKIQIKCLCEYEWSYIQTYKCHYMHYCTVIKVARWPHPLLPHLTKHLASSPTARDRGPLEAREIWFVSVILDVVKHLAFLEELPSILRISGDEQALWKDAHNL